MLKETKLVKSIAAVGKPFQTFMRDVLGIEAV